MDLCKFLVVARIQSTTARIQSTTARIQSTTAQIQSTTAQIQYRNLANLLLLNDLV